MGVRRRWWLAGLGVALVALVVISVVLVNRPSAPPKPPPKLAVVALGDSVVAGEGAGSYTAGTDGRDGNFCHRSAAAEVLHVQAYGYVHRYDVGCSGATAEDITHPGQYHEPAQLTQLAGIAKRTRVGAVVVTAGANDDPRFSWQTARCVFAFLLSGPPCSQTAADDWRQRVNAMVPKLTAALRGVRTTMRAAGYADRDYQLVVQSYAAPFGPDVREDLRNLNGCPFDDADLKWFAGGAVSILDDGLRRAADAAQARYLDMSGAGAGHGACSGTAEWFTRLSIDWDDLKSTERAAHAVSASFHPNAAGQAQFARCLSGFLTSGDRSARCVPGPDGNLFATPTAPQ